MPIQPRMLIVGFVLRWKLERSTRDAEGITAISRWSSESNTTGSQPPIGRTPAGVPHLFEPEVQSVGVGLPERRGRAYAAELEVIGEIARPREASSRSLVHFSQLHFVRSLERPTKE
jgi:hypothetical protein